MRKVKMGTLRGKRVFAAVAPTAAFVNEIPNTIVFGQRWQLSFKLIGADTYSYSAQHH